MSSTPPPLWLPALASLTGTVHHDLALLYGIFERDIKWGLPRFIGMPVWWTRTAVAGTNYEETFWHLVTREDAKTSARLFDRLRAERLPWCAAVLANANDPAVKVWDYRKGRGVVRTYAWVEAADYVLVLQKKVLRIGPVVFLVTAYHVDGERTRRQFRAMYAHRVR